MTMRFFIGLTLGLLITTFAFAQPRTVTDQDIIQVQLVLSQSRGHREAKIVTILGTDDGQFRDDAFNPLDVATAADKTKLRACQGVALKLAKARYFVGERPTPTPTMTPAPTATTTPAP